MFRKEKIAVKKNTSDPEVAKGKLLLARGWTAEIDFANTVPQWRLLFIPSQIAKTLAS